MLRLILATALLGSASLATAATAATVVVAGTDDLYNAVTTGFDGTAPEAINVTDLTSITFAVSAGNTVGVGNGTLNDADGIGSDAAWSTSGGHNISGITVPNAGNIAGVFLASTVAPTTPAALDFTASGTDFASLSPLLQQSFFIGDGKTGDATGTTQTFYVPVGATTLYLGFTDECSYGGGPSCFDDNSGSFTVTSTGTAPITGAVPEPTTWALLLAGFAFTGVAIRRRGAPAPRRRGPKAWATACDQAFLCRLPRLIGGITLVILIHTDGCLAKQEIHAVARRTGAAVRVVANSYFRVPRRADS
jgi:hypothetical protein